MLNFIKVKALFTIAVISCVTAQEELEEWKAIVHIQGDSVYGNVTFTQAKDDAPVIIQGILVGLPAGNKGFHVHEKGDLTDGCTSSGTHFNPYGVTHGAPDDEVRHVGDLGNIIFDENEIAEIYMEDSIISLSGDHSIIGRTLVVHTGEDDLGRTDHPDSLTTGNAGGRAGCGIIGIVTRPKENSGSLIAPSLVLGWFSLVRVICSFI